MRNVLDKTSVEVTHYCSARMLSSTRVCIDNSPGDGVLDRGKRHSQGPVGQGSRTVSPGKYGKRRAATGSSDLTQVPVVLIR